MKLFKTQISTTATTSPVGLDKAWNLCKSLPGWFWCTQQPRGLRSCIQKPHNYMAFRIPYSVKILMKIFLIAWSSFIFAYQKHISKIENIWKSMSLWPVFNFFSQIHVTKITVYLKIPLLYKRTTLTWANYKEMIMLILQMFTRSLFYANKQKWHNSTPRELTIKSSGNFNTAYYHKGRVLWEHTEGEW